MQTLFYVHSLFRYLIFFLAIVAFIVLGSGASTQKPFARLQTVLVSVYAVSVELQLLLGLGLVYLGLFTPIVIGHIVCMLAAAVVARMTSVMVRRRTTNQYRIALIGIGVSVVLLILGIAAIQRSPWTMTAL